MGQLTPIDMNDEHTVGLIRYDGDLSEECAASEGVDPELLIEFAERCMEMGWDVVDLNIHQDQEFPLLAHERRDDQGIYVALAPMIEDD